MERPREENLMMQHRVYPNVSIDEKRLSGTVNNPFVSSLLGNIINSTGVHQIFYKDTHYRYQNKSAHCCYLSRFSIHADR